MSVLIEQPSTMMRDWNDVIKAPGRFEGFDYGFEEDEFFDLTHRVEYAVSAAAAGGGAMLDPLHRYIMVKNMGTVPVLLHFNLQANAPNPAFEVSILPGLFVEYVDLWMTVQPSIRVDSAVSSASVECEVLQIGDFTPIEDEPEEFCDLWAVGHTINAGVLTKHNPELPGPWATIPVPVGPLDDAYHWFADVAGVAEDDYWAVGYSTIEQEPFTPAVGLIGQWAGAAWAEVVPEPLPPALFGVWGFSDDLYWAVGGTVGGQGEIWDWDGAAWEVNCTPAEAEEAVYYCVHGPIPAYVLAAGQNGVVSYWNGAAPWVPVGTSMEAYNLYGTWTSPILTSWVCGGEDGWWPSGGAGAGVIYRQLAPGVAAWAPDLIEIPEPPTLRAMWGFNDQDIWCVGDDGMILHWTGGPMWMVVPEPLELEPGKYHYRGVFGCNPWSVWAIGTDGGSDNVIIHWDGAIWTVEHGENIDEGELLGLKGVWVAAP